MEGCLVKDDEKGMAMIVIMQITFCIYSAFTYPQKDVIDSLLYDHNYHVIASSYM